MAYTIRKLDRVAARGLVQPGSLLYRLWKLHNYLVGFMDTHVHGGVTAGAGSTAAANAVSGATGATKVVDQSLRNASGVVQTAGNTTRKHVHAIGRPTALVGALVDGLAALMAASDGHTHAGVATGAGSTATALMVTASAKIATGPGERNSYGNALVVGEGVESVGDIGRPDEVLGELAYAYQKFRESFNNHLHGGVTTGGASTSAPVMAGLFKIADADGRGPDGETVT